MEKLPLETETLYAELVERLLAVETRRTIGRAPGGFVTKTIKGWVRRVKAGLRAAERVWPDSGAEALAEVQKIGARH